jgi:type I restriction enzyme S subunit
VAQPQIPIRDIQVIRIPIPPIAEQEKISDFLSKYDDLIENNRRRIQLLEQAARLLYKEWFVRLRFPGHEHVKIKDGVPEGWKRKKLGEVAPLFYGKGLKEEDRIPGPFPVFGSSGNVGTHEKPLVEGPGIIVGRKGNVGSVFWSEEDFHPIDTVYFIGRDKSSLYLYYSLLHTSFISTDVAVPGLNRDLAHSRELLIAELKLKLFFEEIVVPIHKQIFSLQKYDASLAKARDLLLPRLMNGEIAV